MVTDTTTKDGSSGDLLDDDLLEDVPDEGDTGRERISRRPPLPEGMKPGPRKKLRYAKKGGAPVLQPGGERGDALLSAGANGGAPSLQQGQGPDIHGHQGMQGDDRVARGRDGAITVVPAPHESPDDVLCDDADSSRRDRAGGTVDAPEDPAPLHTQDPGTAHDGNLSGNDETPVDPTPPGQQKKTLRPLRPGSGSSSRRVNPAPRAVPGQVDLLLLEDELLDEDGIPGRQGGKRANHAPDATFVEDDLPDGDTASSPDTRGLFGGFGSRNGKRTAPHASVPSNGKKPGFLSSIAGIFAKKVKGEMRSIPFYPGRLDEPSLEGAIRDVNVTYPVNAPFQYVHIEYHNGEGALRYEVREPQLSEDEQFALKIVEQGFEKMISTNLDMIAGGDRVAHLKDRFLSIVLIFGIQATEEQKERMFFHLCKKYLGYSHMDTLMMDKYIEDISCNGSEINLYVMHRIYGSVQTDVQFREVELNNFVLRLAQIGGRHISLLQPIRDVTLPDGSRANLTLGSEVTKKGSTFTIRKFRTNPISPIEMMEYGTIDAQQLAYLWLLMEYKRSILVSGGTATGKTTMLNVLCSFIPSEYKIVSIEDTAELNLLHPNWIQSVTRTGFGGGESSAANLSGVSGISRRSPGDISLYDLLVAALRQRPEFIIVGEVRGEEAFTLFQAIAVGHAALGTIHAGSINELLARIESNPMRVPRALFSNLDAVIFPMHIMRGERSARRVANITEVLELDRDTGDLITNTSFKWVPDRDEFRFQGRTYLFDKIKDTYGISTDTLRSELEHRIQFLEWLQKKGVKDYHLVTRMIRHYQRNRDLVIDRIRENGEVADLLEAEGSSYNPLKAIGEESGNTELMED
jgi:flagellar protein FlaI